MPATPSDLIPLNWSRIAAGAYGAYAASTGNKNFRGDPMPAFADLTPAIRTAWEAAVRHSYDLANGCRPEHAEPGRWAGWKPTQARGGA